MARWKGAGCRTHCAGPTMARPSTWPPRARTPPVRPLRRAWQWGDALATATLSPHLTHSSSQAALICSTTVSLRRLTAVCPHLHNARVHIPLGTPVGSGHTRGHTRSSLCRSYNSSLLLSCPSLVSTGASDEHSPNSAALCPRDVITHVPSSSLRLVLHPRGRSHLSPWPGNSARGTSGLACVAVLLLLFQVVTLRGGRRGHHRSVFLAIHSCKVPCPQFRRCSIFVMASLCSLSGSERFHTRPCAPAAAAPPSDELETAAAMRMACTQLDASPWRTPRS